MGVCRAGSIHASTDCTGHTPRISRTCCYRTKTQERKDQAEPTIKEIIQNVLNRYESGYDMAALEQVLSCFSEAYLSNGRTYQDVKTKVSHFFETYHQIDMTLTDVSIHIRISLLRYRNRNRRVTRCNMSRKRMDRLNRHRAK